VYGKGLNCVIRSREEEYTPEGHAHHEARAYIYMHTHTHMFPLSLSLSLTHKHTHTHTHTYIYICSREEEEALRRGRMMRREQLRESRCQYLYFCTSKASKLSESLAQVVLGLGFRVEV
jgi:hypothetical protein